MSIITGRRLNYFFKKISDVFSKKSIYGDTTVSFGRESDVGDKSFVFGSNNRATALLSTALGGTYNRATAKDAAVLGGSNNYATGANSGICGGYYNEANKLGSANLGGYENKATGEYAVTLGGRYSRAANYGATSLGKYNKAMTTGGDTSTQVGDVLVVGNGTGTTSLSNAFRIAYDGSTYGIKAYSSSGADYAEFIKPWADGNKDNEDRVGYFVTIKDGMLYKANSGDYIAGITSGNPSVIGNGDEDYYWKYERDEFNRIVMEDVPEIIQQTDKEGNLVFDNETGRPVMFETGKTIHNGRMKLSDNYDPAMQENYIERKERKEWDYVGMVGVIPVRDDGTCVAGQFCKCGGNGIATLANERGFDTYYVIERVSDNIVKVIVN